MQGRATSGLRGRCPCQRAHRACARRESASRELASSSQPSDPRSVIAFSRPARAGAVVVCCNPRFTGSELQHQLADAGGTVVVVLSRLYPLVKAARAGTAVEHVIVTNIKEGMPPVVRLLFTVAKEKKDGHRQPYAGDPGAIASREVLAAPG